MRPNKLQIFMTVFGHGHVFYEPVCNNIYIKIYFIFQVDEAVAVLQAHQAKVPSTTVPAV